MERTCNKAFFAFLTTLTALLASGGNGLLFGQSSAGDSSSSPDRFSDVSKDIQQSVKALGYSDDIDIDLVQMVGGWHYTEWKKTIDQSRQDYQQKKISANQADQAEEGVLKELCQAIRKEFAPAAADSEYFYLSKVIKDRTAQSLGYSQLLYIFGNAIGLPVKVVDVLEPTAGPLPAGEEHTVCLVGLSSGNVIMADLTQETAIGKAFVFREQYGAAGNFWEFKHQDNPIGIHRRIQILDKNGIVAGIYSNLGYAYAESGKDDEAISFLTKAIELNTRLAKAYSSRGVEFIKKDQRTKALADLERAVQLDPKGAEAYNNLGSVYLGLRQDEKALECFTKAIQLKPDFSDPYKSRGTIYIKLKKNNEAIADLAKAVQLNPKDADTYFRLSAVYDQAGQQSKVIPNLTKAIEINPKFAEAYNARGISYSMSGKYTDAISDFINATEINPKYADAHFNRGTAYMQLGQNNLAVTYLTKALEINPKHVRAYINRGTTYLTMRQNDKAEADFTRAIRYNPKNAEAYYKRGIANAELKKIPEAKKDLQKAADLNPALKKYTQKILADLK